MDSDDTSRATETVATSDRSASTEIPAGSPDDAAALEPRLSDTFDELLGRWEDQYRLGQEPDLKSLCGMDSPLFEPLRDRIGKLKDLYAVLGLSPNKDQAAEPAPAFPGHEVIAEIGRGGMGVVYKARDLKLARIVAIKTIVGSQYATRDQLDRFFREAQAAARLRHPNIIPIHAIGEHEGRPFISLEYADGGSLAARLAQAPMEPREAAALVETLARAVEVAHRAGIVHRDLKPSNVLLTGDRVAKVSDFGLAKLLDADSGSTLSGQVLGTPSYMAPEQTDERSKQVGPAADVYGLGAVLYQALTGRPPFLGSAALETLNLVNTTAVVPPKQLRPEVPKDLETICVKCLEKEPAKRFPSAEALADDLRRFLEGRAIQARPVGWPERGRRWCRRNPWVAGLSAAVFVSLLLGFGVSTTLAVRAMRAEAATRNQRDIANSEAIRARDAERSARLAEAATRKERDRAELEAEISKAVNEFLQKDMLAQASANNQASLDTKPDPDLKVRTALDRAAARIGVRFAGKPVVEASIRRMIGATYAQLGLLREAQIHLERALELSRGALPAEDPESLETRHTLGEIYIGLGKLSEAEPLLIQARDGFRRVRGPEHADTLAATNTLGQLYLAQGKLADAEETFFQTREGRRRANGDDAFETLEATNNLAMVYRAQGKYADAEPLLRQAIEGTRRLRGPGHPDALTAMNNLAQLYFLRDKLADAERLFDEVLKARREVLGPAHPYTLGTKSNLAQVYQRQRKFVEAERLFLEVLQFRRDSLPPDHPDTLYAMNDLAGIYYAQNKLSEAEKWFERTLEGHRRSRGDDHADTLWVMSNLAMVYTKMGKLLEAERLLHRALDGSRRTLGPDHLETLRAMGILAIVNGYQGRYAEGESLWIQVLAGRRSALGEQHNSTLDAKSYLAECQQALGKLDQAEALFDEALEGRRRVLGAEHPVTLGNMEALGAIRCLRKKFVEAEPVLRECLEIRKKTMPDEWPLFNIESLLGGSLLGQKKFAEAEPLLLHGYEGMKAREKIIPPQDKVRLRQAVERIVRLFKHAGRLRSEPALAIIRSDPEFQAIVSDLMFPADPFAP